MSVAVGDRYRDGIVAAFLAGSAGLYGGAEGANCCGTTQGLSTRRSTQARARTLPAARIVPRSDLPLPYSLDVFALVDQRGRVARRERRPVFFWCHEPLMQGEYGEYCDQSTNDEH